MSPSFSDLLPYLLAIAGLSLAMVFVMVRWTAAMLPPPPGEAAPIAPVEGWSPAWRWGFAYAAVWALLIVAFLRFLERVRPAPAGRNLLLMLLVAAGWLLFNWGFIVLVRALQRANERDAARAREEELYEEEPAEAEEAVAAEPEIEPAPAPPPTIGARIRGVLQTVLMLAGALLVIVIGEALPPLQRLHAWTVAHQKTLLIVTIPMAVIGLALFISGIVVILALSKGRAMSREEIEVSTWRSRQQSPALWRRGAYRSSGLAVGVSGEDSASFSEIKEAWRDGTWRTDPRWRRMFLVLLGVALLTTGIFGSIFVVAQAGMKLLLGGVYLYAVVRTAIGFARA